MEQEQFYEIDTSRGSVTVTLPAFKGGGLWIENTSDAPILIISSGLEAELRARASAACEHWHSVGMLVRVETLAREKHTRVVWQPVRKPPGVSMRAFRRQGRRMRLTRMDRSWRVLEA